MTRVSSLTLSQPSNQCGNRGPAKVYFTSLINGLVFVVLRGGESTTRQSTVKQACAECSAMHANFCR
jgi:hypothetical protein